MMQFDLPLFLKRLYKSFTQIKQLRTHLLSSFNVFTDKQTSSIFDKLFAVRLSDPEGIVHKLLQSFATTLFGQYEQLVFFQLYEHILSSLKSVRFCDHTICHDLLSGSDKRPYTDGLKMEILFIPNCCLTPCSTQKEKHATQPFCYLFSTEIKLHKDRFRAQSK